MISPFGVGELVEVDTASVRAVGRVRECSGGGRLHIAFEMGQYMPWVDTDVHVRHFGNDPGRSCVAKIIHAGASTALLQLVGVTNEEPGRGAYDTMPTLD